MDLLPFFKRLGITDIYWSHKTKSVSVIDGINIHPFPLFPVMSSKRKKHRRNKPLKERKYLYSFIGSYQPLLYLTPVRNWIFSLKARPDEFILQREEWHFESDVYRKQISGLTLDERERIKKQLWEHEYTSVLEDSVFCLCPSGSGPNSIRLWEAPLFGSVPVLLSDSLCLEGIPSMENLVIKIEESISAVRNLPAYLRDLSQDAEYIEKKQKALNSIALQNLFCETLTGN
ncbi:exostosin domain-containing protein [Microbulbifer marinus]|nr:exostosin family protein [Microbulbifer marinus]